MNQKLKATALIAAAIMLLAGMPAVAAAPVPTSNLNTATASVFSSDVDNYLTVNNFSKVTFDKNFAFVGLKSGILDLGFATKIGSLYLGGYYNGTMLNENNAKVTETVDTDVTLLNGVIASTKTTTTKQLSDTACNSVNNANVLLGIAGMGFKLGFNQWASTWVAPTAADTLSLVTTDTADNSTSSTVYSNTSKENSSMTPSIQWGMNLPIGDMILKPNATVAVEINQSNSAYTKDVTKTVAGSTPLGFPTVNEVSSTSSGYIDPSAKLNANLTFAKVDGAQATMGLTYEFHMPLYGEGTKASKVTKTTTLAVAQTTTATVTDVTTTPHFDMSNTVTPAFYYTKDFGDQLSVGFNAKATVQILNQKDTPTKVTTTVTATDKYDPDLSTDTTITQTITAPGVTTETTTLTVTPTLKLGFVYKVVPNKLSLNAGYAIAAPVFTNTVESKTRSAMTTTTTKTVDGNGVTISDTTAASNEDRTLANAETRTTTTSWGTLSGTLTFGPTFNFNDNFALDASVALGTGGTASLFGFGGDSILAASYSLMFSLKY